MNNYEEVVFKADTKVIQNKFFYTINGFVKSPLSNNDLIGITYSCKNLFDEILDIGKDKLFELMSEHGEVVIAKDFPYFTNRESANRFADWLKDNFASLLILKTF